MATLARRFTWKKWAPDIGENRELEGGPVLFLELASGLTGEQLAAIGEALATMRSSIKYAPPVPADDATPEERLAASKAAMADYLAAIRAVYVEAFAPYVRVHGGPHTVDGQPLANLNDYLRIIEEAADLGVNARGDLEAALARFNSIEGPDELFSLRSSGGARSTGAQRIAQAGTPKASR
jgi:hypothetical protein